MTVSSFSSPLFPDSNGWGCMRSTPTLALPHVHVRRGRKVSLMVLGTYSWGQWCRHAPRSIRHGNLPVGTNTCPVHLYVFLYFFDTSLMVPKRWLCRLLLYEWGSWRRFRCSRCTRPYLCGTLQVQHSSSSQAPVQLPIQVGASIGRRTPAKGMDFPMASPCFLRDVPGNQFSRWLNTFLHLEGKPRRNSRTQFGTVPGIAAAAFRLQAAARCVGFYLIPIILKSTSYSYVTSRCYDINSFPTIRTDS